MFLNDSARPALGVFYVYVYLKPDGSPFYVGKGVNDRYMNNTRNAWCRKTLSKYRGRVRVEFIEAKSEAEAFHIEMTLILLYVNAGEKLCNMTIGGEGRCGRALTAEHSAKLSESVKRAWQDPEKRARLLATKREWADGFWTKERRAALSARVKGRKKTPEELRKLSEAQLGKPKSPETRARMAEAARKRWADPGGRAKMMAVNFMHLVKHGRLD